MVARGCRTLGTNPWMALLVYLDAGGSSKLPALSAAGYIAREEQWAAFDRDWAEALQDAGVSALHMKDFAHSRKEFTSWKADEPRRAAFLSRLAEIIKRHTLKHVAVTLFVDVYDKLNAKATVRERLGGPYVLTMLTAIVLTNHWRDRNAPSEPMAVFVEHGDEDQGVLIDCVRRLEYQHPVTPLRKSSTVDGMLRYVLPFQAADFLAYEYQKGMRTMRARGVVETQSRRSFFNLFPVHGPDDYSRVIDVHGLGELCKKFGVRRRR